MLTSLTQETKQNIHGGVDIGTASVVVNNEMVLLFLMFLLLKYAVLSTGLALI